MNEHNIKPGDYVIYISPQGPELGKVKGVDGEGAFVWYHTGCTAAKTPFERLLKITNGHVIDKDLFGGVE